MVAKIDYKCIIIVNWFIYALAQEKNIIYIKKYCQNILIRNDIYQLLKESLWVINCDNNNNKKSPWSPAAPAHPFLLE